MAKLERLDGIELQSWLKENKNEIHTKIIKKAKEKGYNNIKIGTECITAITNHILGKVLTYECIFE